VQAQENVELPSSKQEVSDALTDLRDRYGLDAVKLESYLLQYAIQAGAVLTAGVTMGGLEEIDGATYLRVDFDTGIVYAAPQVSRAQAPARIWTDIVDPTLRQFHSMEIAADGILLQIRFRNSVDNSVELLRQRRQDSLRPDVVSFRLRCRDIVDSVRSNATPTQLLGRAVVFLNDTPATFVLGEASATRRPEEAVTPLLPLE
jgi:hypothetical protein